jgi:hypothetical protein
MKEFVLKDEVIVATIQAKIPTIFNAITSYRSECSGILGTLQFIMLIHEYATTKNLHMNETITIVCDNKSAIDNVINMLKYKPTLKHYNSADIDIIQEIHKIIYFRKSQKINIF